MAGARCGGAAGRGVLDKEGLSAVLMASAAGEKVKGGPVGGAEGEGPEAVAGLAEQGAGV